MSIDLRIEQICTHLVVDEVTTLSRDLRTVTTLRPISNSQVELKINGFLVEDSGDALNGFSLVRNASSVDPTARLLKFKKLRRATDEYYEVTYYTRRTECRRCMGLKVENDYRFTLDGQLETVEDDEKLMQEVKKVITTLIGSNIFHTWYGTSIPSLIGSKLSNAGFIRTKITNEINQALTQYASIQKKQAQARPGTVSAGERFGRLLQVSVEQDITEPTAFNISLAFSNQRRETMTTTMAIKIPDPQSLVYNTPQSVL